MPTAIVSTNTVHKKNFRNPKKPRPSTTENTAEDTKQSWC